MAIDGAAGGCDRNGAPAAAVDGTCRATFKLGVSVQGRCIFLTSAIMIDLSVIELVDTHLAV